MRLLIIEDDNVQIEMYNDNIQSFNKNKNVTILPCVKKNLEQGKKALLDPIYDAAIIDLKLSDNSDTLEGKEIVEQIIGKLRIPVFIVSGSIGQIEIDENCLLKKRSRDSEFKLILQEIWDIYDTGLTKLLGSKGVVNEYINDIFWKHLTGTIDLWVSDKVKSSEEKQKSLSRYVLSHVQEYLELTTESDFEKYHAAEFYITPPIKNKIYTGDIIKELQTGKRYIVLTPSCDLAQAKAKEVLLVEIESEKEGILVEKINVLKKLELSNNEDEEVLLVEVEYREEGVLKDSISRVKKGVKTDSSDPEVDLKRIISNSYSNKYHYLPNYKDICVGLINFQKLKTVKYKECKESNNKYERIASVNSSFTKDIVARFSYYYSRQGSPDFNIDEIYESLISK